MRARSSGGGRLAGKRGRPAPGAPSQGSELLPPRLAAGGMKASGPGSRAAGVGKEGRSGGRLRSSSGRSPPKAKIAALSWASSGSSMLEQAESTSEDLGFRVGLAAVGRAGGFFWVSLRRERMKEIRDFFRAHLEKKYCILWHKIENFQAH